MVISWPSLIVQDVWTYVLIFCRLGSAFLVYPGVGESYVPVRVRLCFAVVCTVCAKGALPELAPFGDDFSLASIEPVLREVALGLGAGLLVRLVFLTLEAVGTIWGMQTGLSHVLLLQPLLNQPASLWGHVLVTYVLTLLFTTDGHHLFIRGLMRSFQVLPLGHGESMASWATMATSVGAACMQLALTLSAPLIGAGLVFYITLGLLNRVMPHVQVFFVVQPLQVLLGFAMISVLIVQGLNIILSVLMPIQSLVWSHG